MSGILDTPVLRYPVDPSHPDSHSIIYALQERAIIFGRDPRVRIGAEMLLTTYAPYLGQNDVPGQIKALTAAVKENVRFVSDPEGTEYIQDPVTPDNDPPGLLEKILLGIPALGDCDDHCLLLAAMLRSLGIRARIAAVHLTPQSAYYDHVIVQVPDGRGGWVDIDPCAKSVLQPNYPDALVANIPEE